MAGGRGAGDHPIDRVFSAKIGGAAYTESRMVLGAVSVAPVLRSKPDLTSPHELLASSVNIKLRIHRLA